MLRSLYAGISGMSNNQTQLDVVGNNIANVNTPGFKRGRATFQDMLSQTNAGATGPGGNLGGTNPQQVGLGSQIGAIDTLHTQGFLQSTGNPLDLAIEGDGMFAVSENTDGTGQRYYTRAGNFYLDGEGDIVNADGYYLLDSTGGTINIPTNAQSFSIGDDGTVTALDTDGYPISDVDAQVGIAKFSNPAGLEKIGGSLYADTDNAGLDTGEGEDINDALNVPGAGGTGSLVTGTLEMSNVDLATEFTEMIVAQRAFQANARIITTSDQVLQELINLKQ